MSPARTHDAGGEENCENEEGHPITDSLQTLVRLGHSGQVETSEKVPIHDGFDVELDGCHDDPEHVPGEGGRESQRQHHTGPRDRPVGGARGRGLISHFIDYCYH